MPHLNTPTQRFQIVCCSHSSIGPAFDWTDWKNLRRPASYRTEFMILYHFKGSSGENVGKNPDVRSIFEDLDRIKKGWWWRHSKLRVTLCRIRLLPRLNSQREWLSYELPLNSYLEYCNVVAFTCMLVTILWYHFRVFFHYFGDISCLRNIRHQHRCSHS